MTNADLSRQASALEADLRASYMQAIADEQYALANLLIDQTMRAAAISEALRELPEPEQKTDWFSTAKQLCHSPLA